METHRKSRLNFVIEGVTLLVLMLMIATGLIMEFRLPPGSGGEGAALHGGVGRTALTLAGVSRHQWGAIHFYLAMTMLLLLVLHLYLHWRWIWALAQGSDPARRKMRGRTFLGASVLFLALAGLPWVISTHRVAPFSSMQTGQSNLAMDSDEEARLAFPVNGRTTLNEIAQAAGVSLAEVIACLEVQGPVGGEERLGPLTRRLGISMAQVRERLGALNGRREGGKTESARNSLEFQND